MKNLLLLIALFTSSISWSQNVTISGTVENAQGDTLTLSYDPLLLGIKPQTQRHIFTAEKTFKFGLDIDKSAIIELRYQKQQIILFISKDDKIELSFDGKDVHKNIVFKGNHALSKI